MGHVTDKNGGIAEKAGLSVVAKTLNFFLKLKTTLNPVAIALHSPLTSDRDVSCE